MLAFMVRCWDSAARPRMQRLYEARDLEGLIALGSEHGFVFSRETFREAARAAIRRLEEGQLSDEELAGLAGGGLQSVYDNVLQIQGLMKSLIP